MIQDQEIENFLNILLPLDEPKQKRSVTGNNTLNSKNINDLYDIVRSLCSHAYNHDSLVKGIKDIAAILKDINYNQNISYTNGRTKKGQKVTVPSGYTNMPFLIKQVLYFLCVRVLQFGDNSGKHYTQNDVWEELTDNGITIGHNVFSQMFGKITPDRYYRCISYYQPKNPLSYMGQKKGRLGIAIKHLAEQAKVDSGYDTFVDVFGGSSSAIVAHKYRKNVRYIYNDINSLMINYVKVVSSDTLHDKLIVALKEVKDFIENGIVNGTREDVEFMDSFYEKTEEYIRKPIKKQKLTDKVKNRITNINGFGNSEVDYSPEDIEKFLQKFQTNIVKGNKQYIDKTLKGKEFGYGFIGQKKQYKYSDVAAFHLVSDFLNNQEVIRYLINDSYNKNGGYYSASLYSSNAGMSFDEIQEEFRRYRAWGILIYCKEMYYEVFMQKDWKPKDTKEKVEAAKVLMIMRYFSVNLEIGSDSSVTLDKKSHKKIRTFCEEDFDDSISKYHQALKRVNLKDIYNMDCVELIEKTNGEDKKILYYVDSPYIETTGYVDGKDEENIWTMDKMNDLIDALFESNQKFIFSMRTCMMTNNEEQKHKTNEAILGVLECLLECNNKLDGKLHVLAADFDMDLLEDHIKGVCMKKKPKCEIMITNYPIKSFYDIGWDGSAKSQKKVRINSAFINEKAYKVLEYDVFYSMAKKALKDILSNR